MVGTVDGTQLLEIKQDKAKEVGDERIYNTLPPRLVRMELEDGRVRWSKDDLVDDFIFYLRCNHELIGMLYTHPAHPTDRPTRFILFGFSFSIGMAFEVLLQELMGETAQTWVIGLWLGLICSVIFFFLEHFLTCSCIRKKMDQDEQDRLEKGEGALTKDSKSVRETAFVCARLFGGCAGCCCFAPFAIGCYW